MRESHFEKVTKSATTFFARWEDSHAIVRELTTSLRTLRIVLFRDASAMRHQNLVVSAIDPLWMHGPFAWHPALLQVDVVRAGDTPVAGADPAAQLFRLHAPVGFELLTGSLEVAENVKLR